MRPRSHGLLRDLFLDRPRYRHDAHHDPRRSRLVLGGGLLAFGIAWWLQDQGVTGPEGLWLAVPAILAWSAAVRLALDRSAPSVVRALVRLALAAYLFVVVEQAGELAWATTWPVLAIGAGVVMIVDALFARSRPCASRPGHEEATW